MRTKQGEIHNEVTAMDEYKDLRERLEMLISEQRIFRNELHEEIAKLKVNQHKIEEQLTAMENIVNQMRLIGTPSSRR